MQVVRYRQEHLVGPGGVERLVERADRRAAEARDHRVGELADRVVGERDLRATGGGDRAGVGEADVAAPDDGEAQRAGAAARLVDRRGRQRHPGPPARPQPRRPGHAGGPHALVARDPRPVEVGRIELVAAYTPVRAIDLARVDALAGEVLDGHATLRERVDEAARRLGEEVLRGAPSLDRQRADVRADQAHALLTDLVQRHVVRHAARRPEQDDGAAGSRGGNGGAQRLRIARGLDHGGGPDLAQVVVRGKEARRAGAHRGLLAALTPRDNGHRSGVLEHRHALCERADRARAHDADGLAGDLPGAPDAVAGDHGEVGQRGIARLHTGGHGDDPPRRHGHHGRMSCAQHRDGRADLDPRDVAADAQHASRARVARRERQFGPGVRQAQPLRALRARADRGRKHLDGHLARAGCDELERPQLGAAGSRDDDAEAADDPAPHPRRLHMDEPPVDQLRAGRRHVLGRDPADGERAIES